MLGFSQLIINVVIVSSEQERYSAIHRHVFILPQTPLSSRLPHNAQQSSMCYTVGPCWLSILNVTVQTPFLTHHCLSQSLFPYYICHSFFIEKVKESEVAQSCLTLCNPLDCSLPGSSIHGIFQARLLEWIAISFSRRSSQPRDWTQVSCIEGRRFTFWATREVIFHWKTNDKKIYKITQQVWGLFLKHNASK